MRKTPLLLLVPLLLSTVSCVYFNVFYNAEKYFRMARTKQMDRLRSAPDSSAKVMKDEEDLYGKSIEKCSKVLKLYPQNKKYNAKATLLLGEIYYCEAKYSEAVRKFNEYISNYPDAKDFFQALYLKGLCYYEQQDYPKAETELENVASNAPARALRTKARYMLAEISLLKGSSFQAIDQLKKMEGGSRAFNSLINYKMGNLLFMQKEYKEAYKYFMAVEQVKLSNVLTEARVPENIKYLSDIMAGRCLKESGDLTPAIAHFKALLEKNAYYKHFGDITIHLALCLAENKQYEEAKKLFLKVIQDYPKTPASASACYHAGLLYENSFHDMAEAFSYYRKAFAECDKCAESELARTRYEGLRSIMFLQSDLDSMLAKDTSLTKSDSALIDSVRKMEPMARHFNVAEIYLYKLSRADSAVVQYRKILALDSVTDSSRFFNGKMKALYAVAWINKNLLSNATLADSLFSEILASYPATEYAKAAEQALGREATVMTRADSIMRQFMSVESLYTTRNDCRAAVNGFQDFVKTWPEVKLTPKAVLASAWLSENCLGDNTAAESYYQILHEKYAETEYGRFARRKLEGKKSELKDIFVEKPGEGPEGTTLSKEMAGKMASTDGGSKEETDEGSWVTLASLDATDGKMEGALRSREALMEEITPALETIDETYIDMVDEGLGEEGDFTVQVWIKKSGEVSKLKIDKEKTKILDKMLNQEIEKILTGMMFQENAPEDLVVQLNMKFKKRSVDSGSKGEDEDEEE